MTRDLDAVGTLFEQQQTVAAIHIKDYLDWASDPETYPKTLAIPPIQRGFVWKPKQIQDLWDSLLRGMPIGSILLKEFLAGAKIGSITPKDRQQIDSSKSGFHLMDGQQRTLSMLLGFPQSLKTEHKLWVDLSAPGKDGSLFRLRVSTVTQPFGYQLDGRRLPMRDRDDARNAWDRVDKGNDQMNHSQIFELAKPWKANGANQGGLFEIKCLWRELLTQGFEAWVQHVRGKIVELGGLADGEVEGRISSFGKGLSQLQSQWLALIKIPHIDEGEEFKEPQHDYLTMLFDRVSSGGTRLRPDDLLFSMVKQHWPAAHNLVYEIQKEVGSMMKPTDFVMTAYRLAALQGNAIADDPNPGAKSFHKNLGVLLGLDNNPGKLRQMIADRSLENAFTSLKELLKFRDDVGNDYGLPLAMFPYLDVPLLQVLLFWMQKRNAGSVITPQERVEIVRFSLYWLVCNMGALSRQEASRKAIAIIKGSGSNRLFPAVEIYKNLSKESLDGRSPLFCALVAPPEKSTTTDLFRNQTERAEYYFPTNIQLHHNFSNRKALLIWFQRDWIHSQCLKGGDFEEFKPLAGQDDDVVPYDFDHLVPQSNWSSLQRHAKREGSEVKKFENLWSRRSLGNSIGNYRVMSARENRSRGDEALEIGFFGIEDKKEKWAHFSMECSDEALMQWRKASPQENPHDWDNNRVLAFQVAVESRTLYLYERYYTDLGFDSWLNVEFE